ncbi:MAG: hypothetical protein A2504_14210 [Bdellovibrionales bacterium RIFOXYD12_FULL_39_22]|nr:MAG: hypothetical protein A2385_04645 [Bdellovibrionales bacterium RIFOXYB1_FULL_39_21]OFZ43436.1 MAG: hypothetical protein A2485_13160 [Bdellovibrionales bacterium RIFOXYC12_FULL_39_17]OFZ46979.1 MAG: hypothetical protein A2404_00220 [Bdellovibrionales bacterium RIFOXYC1_FULL_39_130]OFZ76176.1 MAG: hypothetical protein A2560_07470 [Bdellovibrionales bacterium RIFOXYD1_FULL_39_84]OFZ94411.1 MAG: hypothetical protein A2504_14210 [Bdellovibrionales bacterium RIFOXYD12_FULL_39_22]HLE10548.1 ty
MKCSFCESKKELKKSKANYRYKDCGLDNVTLIDVPILKCHECGEELIQFGDLEKLHATIAKLLLHKADLLKGSEIRFLRKHLGYSGIMFAHLIGYAHETLSRIETGAQPVVETLDRLVRFAIGNKMPDRDYDLHDMILNNTGKKFSRIELKRSAKGEWMEKKAA